MARLSPDLRRAGSAKETDAGAAPRPVPRLLWLLPLAVALAVAAGALFQYAGPLSAARHVYVATRQVRLAVPLTGASTSYDGYLARQTEDAAARNLASGALQSPALDTAIAAEYVAERSRAPQAAQSADIPPTVTAADVAAALSATHAGNLVTLAARWRTPDGAQALLTAAVDVLVAGGAPAPASLSPTPPEQQGQAGEPVMVQVAGPPSGTALDGTVEAAALDTLLVRLAFAVAAGMLTLMAVWAVVTRRFP